MSQVKGTISVDVAFTDSTTVGGAQSLKTITLREATEYTTGKVAVVTGTVGTAAVTIGVFPTTYKDASGNAVSFSTIYRTVFRANPGAYLRQAGLDELIASRRNEVCACSWDSPNDHLEVTSLDGTASYTLVIYGT